MGYYILTKERALRSWEAVPYTYIRRLSDRPQRLDKEEYETALLCDGKTELQGSEVLSSLLRRGIVEECRQGEASLTKWQKPRKYPYHLTLWLGLEITGRCNYNCLHCFNAADNSQLQSELSLWQIRALLDDASEAGVQAVLLTGGEPLLHPDFREIVQAVYDRDMFVHELNTNGALLTPDVVDFVKSFGNVTEFKISFDGLGYHDWMRGCKGAEERTLKALRLCVDEGVPLRVQMNVNRRNKDSICPTLELLDEIGVPRVRMICTTSTPRWDSNAPGAAFTWEEYLESSLEISEWFAKSGLGLELNIWHVITMEPERKAYSLDRVRCDSRTYRDFRPVCPTINGMPTIAANGNIYPCLQYSGTTEARGVSLGNVVKDGLLPLLKKGVYYDIVHARVSDRLSKDYKCATCEWHTWCNGGCPALGYLFDGKDFLAYDPTACVYFENGWPERFEKSLQGWTNNTPIL